jgi:hypothetical protein
MYHKTSLKYLKTYASFFFLDADIFIRTTFYNWSTIKLKCKICKGIISSFWCTSVSILDSHYSTERMWTQRKMEAHLEKEMVCLSEGHLEKRNGIKTPYVRIRAFIFLVKILSHFSSKHKSIQSVYFLILFVQLSKGVPANTKIKSWTCFIHVGRTLMHIYIRINKINKLKYILFYMNWTKQKPFPKYCWSFIFQHSAPSFLG